MSRRGNGQPRLSAGEHNDAHTPRLTAIPPDSLKYMHAWFGRACTCFQWGEKIKLPTPLVGEAKGLGIIAQHAPILLFRIISSQGRVR